MITVIYWTCIVGSAQVHEKTELSQRDLSKLLGVPDIYMGKCERRDRRVDPIEMIRWCKACGIDPIDLVAAIKPKARNPR